MSRSVDLFLRAHDETTPVFHAVADASESLMGDFDNLRTEGVQLSASFEDAGSALSGLRGELLAGVAAIGALGVALGLAARQVFRFSRDAIQSFVGLEDAQRELSNALGQLGGDTDALSSHFEQYALAMEQATNVTRTTTTELLTTAARSGIAADELDSVTTAAIGLADTLDMDARQAMQAIIREIQTGDSALSDHIQGLDDATTATERLAIIQKQAQRGFGQVEDATDTAGGAFDRIRNTMTTVRQTIGEALSPALIRFGDLIAENEAQIMNWATRFGNAIGSALDMAGPVFAAMSQMFNDFAGVVRAAITSTINMANTFGASMQTTEDLVSGSMQGMAGVFRWGAQVTVGSLAAMEFAIEHWGQIHHEAVLRTALGLQTIWEEFKWFFGEAIPTVARNFATGIGDIWTMLLDFTKTVFSNLAQNVAATVTSIPGLIRGNVDFSDVWTPLLDEFEMTVSEMEPIAKRKFSRTQMMLAQMIREEGGALGKSFGKHIANRLREAGLLDLPGSPGTPGGGQQREGGEAFRIPPIELNPSDRALLSDATGGGGMSGPRGQLQAREFRFLTRAPGHDDQLTLARQTAQSTQSTTQKLTDATTLLQQMLNAINQLNRNRILVSETGVSTSNA